MENIPIQTIWISRAEAEQIIGVKPSTLYHWLCARKIHPRCARKFGRNWKFNRRVLEEYGLIFHDQPFPLEI